MALFVLSLCPLGFSVGVGASVIGLSQISSFLSLESLGITATFHCDINSKMCILKLEAMNS